MSAIVLSHRKLTCHPNWPMQGCPLKMTTFCVNICPSTYMFILSACQGNLNMNIYVITIRPNGVHRSWLDNDHDKGRLTGLRTMHQRDNRVKYDSPAGWMVNIYICVYICILYCTCVCMKNTKQANRVKHDGPAGCMPAPSLPSPLSPSLPCPLSSSMPSPLSPLLPSLPRPLSP